jgi:UPF0042 nucleotide-binding protein
VSEFIVITGLSGAGRSQAANVLEDLGWFVIDNLPPALIDKVTELAQAPGTSIDQVALVVGPRAGLKELTSALATLRATGARVRVLFLEASDKVLVRRYTDTRRRHPLAEGEGIVETIERERVGLEPVKAEADVVVDTTELNVHQLRDRIVALFGVDNSAPGMQTTVMSFGYKHGLPLDADLVVDCRFLPNPHWVEVCAPTPGRTPTCGATCWASPKRPTSSVVSTTCSTSCSPPTSRRASRTSPWRSGAPGGATVR